MNACYFYCLFNHSALRDLSVHLCTQLVLAQSVAVLKHACNRKVFLFRVNFVWFLCRAHCFLSCQWALVRRVWLPHLYSLLPGVIHINKTFPWVIWFWCWRISALSLCIRCSSPLSFLWPFTSQSVFPCTGPSVPVASLPVWHREGGSMQQSYQHLPWAAGAVFPSSIHSSE